MSGDSADDAGHHIIGLDQFAGLRFKFQDHAIRRGLDDKFLNKPGGQFRALLQS